MAFNCLNGHLTFPLQYCLTAMLEFVASSHHFDTCGLSGPPFHGLQKERLDSVTCSSCHPACLAACLPTKCMQTPGKASLLLTPGCPEGGVAWELHEEGAHPLVCTGPGLVARSPRRALTWDFCSRAGGSQDNGTDLRGT